MAKTDIPEPKTQKLKIEIANVVGLQPTDEENAKVLRKIDMVLMPVMCVCYMLQLLDKLTLNFSSQLGLIQDLNLHGSQYSWSSSIFYFGYFIWTWPSSWLVVKLPLGKYITGTVLVWGAVLMCHGACNNFGELMAARFCLGAAEAAIAPGFSLIVSMFYTRDEQPLRQGLWYAGNCIANIFGGLLCFGIGHIQSSLATWRVLFLILGGVTVAYSTVLWAFLPDSPTKAQFLNDRERNLAVHRTLSSTSSALDENYFQTYQMWEALRDPQAWILALYTFSINICNGGITTVSSSTLYYIYSTSFSNPKKFETKKQFNSLLIQGFGFSEFQTLLLQMPLGGCQLAVLAIMSIMASLFKISRVFLMACACAISLVGMVLVYALHQTDAYGRLGGTYLAAVFAATTPISLSLIASNVGGFTKKSTVNAMLFLAYSLGNIVGPQLYLSSQAPIYTVSPPSFVPTRLPC
jgi:MFS family permease